MKALQEMQREPWGAACGSNISRGSCPIRSLAVFGFPGCSWGASAKRPCVVLDYPPSQPAERNLDETGRLL